jgi:hypothetical protein
LRNENAERFHFRSFAKQNFWVLSEFGGVAGAESDWPSAPAEGVGRNRVAPVGGDFPLLELLSIGNENTAGVSGFGRGQLLLPFICGRKILLP